MLPTLLMRRRCRSATALFRRDDRFDRADPSSANSVFRMTDVISYGCGVGCCCCWGGHDARYAFERTDWFCGVDPWPVTSDYGVANMSTYVHAVTQTHLENTSFQRRRMQQRTTRICTGRHHNHHTTRNNDAYTQIPAATLKHRIAPLGNQHTRRLPRLPATVPTLFYTSDCPACIPHAHRDIARGWGPTPHPIAPLRLPRTSLATFTFPSPRRNANRNRNHIFTRRLWAST